MKQPLAALAVVPLLLGACTYDFSNPAERLDSGEVTGRLVADLSGTGTLSPVAGVTVDLKNSTNSQTSRSNGNFFMLGMTGGRHTLLFTRDYGSGSVWALQRDVELAYGSDGQLEGVVLGDLRLRQSVSIGGTFTTPAYVAIDGYPATPPFAMAIDEATGLQATVTPEGNGATTPYTGRFSYSIPVAAVGAHRIRFVISADVGGVRGTWVGGPLTQNVPDTSEGQSLTLAPTALELPDTFTTGKLRFKASAPPGAPPFTIRVNGVPPTTELNPTADSTGWVELDLVEGAYTVLLDLGPLAGQFQSPAAMTAVVVAGQTTELGTIYVTDTTAASAGYYACFETSDCDAMATCVDGTCKYAGMP